MINHGLFSTLFIQSLKQNFSLDDAAKGRMAILGQTWKTRDDRSAEYLWNSFLKQALGNLEFVCPQDTYQPNTYLLYEDWGFTRDIAVLYLVEPGSDINDFSVGRFYPAKLLAVAQERKLNWGILTDGSAWRLYSLKSSRPFEDFVELDLSQTLESWDEQHYGLFERFFHLDSFVALQAEDDEQFAQQDIQAGIYKCRLDTDRELSEQILEKEVKNPFLRQVDEVLQYICNGFIFDTSKTGEEYSEEERQEIFQSAVKLIYRCLFLFYAEARSLLPSDPQKAELYKSHSIQALCLEARKFRWGKRQDTDQFDLWFHLKGLINAVNEGDPEYGIMGYNGGLFDDEEEIFLGRQKLRNDFLSRALYLLAFVEPQDNDQEHEYAIPYKDLEVRHLGELYENILEYTVQLADADRIRRTNSKGTEIILASSTEKKPGDRLIKKGEVFFGESALERKQTGSYYTSESLVRFLNQKTIIKPLQQIFETKYRQRFNELLDQAKNAIDQGIRRGAAQSAAALVQHFVQEDVLHFKVCDPAMGSGHLLVNAANQMAALVVSLLEEIPYVSGMQLSVTSLPNHWRRLVTRHCIYGVDINPLSVNLAKLSLWLNCFAIDHKLTFLDHHLRCGNSLMGIRNLNQLSRIPERKKDRKKDSQRPQLFDYTSLSNALAEVSKDIASISEVHEDDTDTQKEMLDSAMRSMSRLRPLADLYTAYLMDSDIILWDYKTLFEKLARDGSLKDSPNPNLSRIHGRVEYYRKQHSFFHWPLEFSDVFGPGAAGGFSATVGNPPWDIVKPSSQEFFSSYDPKFRSYKKQEAIKKAKALMDENMAVEDKWNEYREAIARQSSYFREPESFQALGRGDINTFKLFLERFFSVLTTNGQMGIIVPSGLYTDQGCQDLREMFFSKSRIDFLYCFENRRAVFNIHRSFKFVLFGARKGQKTDEFKCAFMEHDPERLPLIDSNALKMTLEHVRKFSPDILSIMEFRDQKTLDSATLIYDNFPLIGKGHKLSVAREFDLTGDANKLSRSENEGIILYEGKMLWLYDCDFSKPRYWIKDCSYKQYYEKDSINRICEIDGLSKKQIQETIISGSIDIAPERYRLAFREVAADTNERTFISTILPIPSPHCYTIRTFETYCPIIENDQIKIINNYPAQYLLYWLGILNSFVFDYVARIKTSNHLSTTFKDLPLPEYSLSIISQAVSFSSLRLICIDKRFADLWEGVYSNHLQSPDFWYPPSAPIDTYGPAHEQEIRKKLRDEAPGLAPEWGPHCGVHDRLPDRRDTEDRAQLRAEIDAYVAHLYGLSRDDFAYILDTFPVLKRKEEKAFGEFMSKRKCLEEYDRIGIILKNSP